MARPLIDGKYFVPLGDVGSLKRTERGIILNVGEEKFRVDLLLPDVVRLKFSQGGYFDENPTFAASFEPPEPPPFELDDGPDEIVLQSESLRLHISKRPFAVDAFRKDGSVIFEDYRDETGAAAWLPSAQRLRSSSRGRSLPTMRSTGSGKRRAASIGAAETSFSGTRTS